MVEQRTSREEEIDWAAMAPWVETLGLYFDFARADLSELQRHLQKYLSRPCAEQLGALEIKAHGMKGAARNVGLERVADVALELEEHFRAVRDGAGKLDPIWVESKLALLGVLLQRSEKKVKQRYGELNDGCQDSDR